MATHTSVQEAYTMDRDFRESARLYIQHCLWGQLLGWQLHPQIEASDEGLSVIDIGTGNRCWLLEVAYQKPKTWSFLGLDSSPANFPARSYLPSNVTLQQCDVFGPLPVELHGRFDVVHVRALTLVVKGGDPHPLTANILRLLKPGGWLQRDDADCASVYAYSPNTAVPSEKGTALLDRWLGYTRKNGLDFGWLSDLPGLFRAHQLTVLDSFRRSMRDDLRKPWTDNFMVALDEVGQLAAERDPGLVGTLEEWQELFRGLVEETARGLTIDIDMVSALGRKET